MLQQSGVSQGCTLSPFLFIILMSVLVSDAFSLLPDEAKSAHETGDLSEVLYADDTLLLGISAQHVEQYLHAISQAGPRHGILESSRRCL